MLRKGAVTGSSKASPWYADGLSFVCKRCGACCGGAPGHVWVSIDESHRIAAGLHLAFEDFTKRHVRRVDSRLSLREKTSGDCEFMLREEPGLTGCAIHATRPVQCRTWPFWTSNLESATAWEHAARECPGIGQGPRHALPVIQAALDANGDLPL